MVFDMLERDRDRRIAPLNHHAQRITDQDYLHATFFNQPCEAIVISRQAGEFFTLLLELLQVGDGYLVLEWLRYVHR